jgi:hypothetical protein
MTAPSFTTLSSLVLWAAIGALGEKNSTIARLTINAHWFIRMMFS